MHRNIIFFAKAYKYSSLALPNKNGIKKPWRFLQGGFIKSTNHRPTDQPTTDHLLTDQRTH